MTVKFTILNPIKLSSLSSKFLISMIFRPPLCQITVALNHHSSHDSPQPPLLCPSPSKCVLPPVPLPPPHSPWRLLHTQASQLRRTTKYKYPATEFPCQSC